MEEWGLSGGVPITRNPDGSITLAFGRTYRQTPERVKRSNGDDAIASGAPLVTDVYPDGTFLFEHEPARDAWTRIRPLLIVGDVRRTQGLGWVGRVWSTDDGSRLVYLEGYH